MSFSRAGQPVRWAAVAIIAFALGTAIVAWVGHEREIDRVTGEAQRQARGAAADLDRYLQARFGLLTAVSRTPPVQDRDLAAIRRYFEELDPASIGFDGGLGWIDRTGMLRVRSDYDGPPLDYSDRDHVQAVLATGQPATGSVFIGAIAQVALVALGVPTYGEDGELTGLIGGGLRLDQLGAATLSVAGGTPVTVVDQRGNIVAGRTPISELVAVHPGFDVAGLQARLEGVEIGASGPTGEEDRLIGFSTVPTSGWLVLVDRSTAEAFGPARTLLAVQLVAIAVATLLALGILLWAARRLDRSDDERSTALAVARETSSQLEHAVARLQEREALRDAFVGVMSHELRTPVTTIFGAAKLLAKSPQRADLESLVEDIEEESDRLYRITEDLLVLSRAEQGRIAITPEPVLVQRLVPSIAQDLQRRYPGTPFELSLPPDLPPVAGEPGPVRQVLNNLLTNAAKYGERQLVTLRGGTADDGRVWLVVEDEGRGFPEEEAERLFDLFYRSPAHERLAAGTGIGLYVVRQLVEAMNGRVDARRRAPRGAAFTVTLPAYDLDVPERRRAVPHEVASAAGEGATVPVS